MADLLLPSVSMGPVRAHREGVSSVVIRAAHRPNVFVCSQVRTKDHRFESVSHLISYHMDNRLPIVSAGSEVCLQQPVERRA